MSVVTNIYKNFEVYFKEFKTLLKKYLQQETLNSYLIFFFFFLKEQIVVHTFRESAFNRFDRFF